MSANDIRSCRLRQTAAPRNRVVTGGPEAGPPAGGPGGKGPQPPPAGAGPPRDGAASVRAVPSLRRPLARHDVLRGAAQGAYRTAARGVLFLPPPRVLATSLPKAGTHLLTGVLDKLPRMMAAGIHRSLTDFLRDGAGDLPPRLDAERLRRTLSAVHNGQFMSAHFPADEALRKLLGELGFATVYIVRDPRDVVVSHSGYVTRTTRHHLHGRYRSMRSDGDRLLASITGLPASAAGPSLESIGSRLRSFAGWLHDPRTYVCRFEGLIGPRGDGSRENQLREIAGLARHVGRELSEGRVEE